MKRETLKSYLIRDKIFLKELYSGPNPLKNNRILNNANDSQLNTLLFYLHFLANGEIKINKSNFEKIEKNKKLSLIKRNVENKKACLSLINNDRSVKLTFLKKLNVIYPNLLYGLFNLT